MPPDPETAALYKPPAAPVVAAAWADEQVPATVRLACRVLWGAPAIIAVAVLVDWLYGERILVTLAVAFVLGTLFGACVFLLTWGLRSRRNWVRWLFTALAALGVYDAVTSLASWGLHWTGPGKVFPERFLDLLLNAVLVVACVLIHTPTARAWFRSRGKGVAG